MIHITLPDGSQREFPGPVTVAEVAASIGAGLAKAALAGKVDGKVVDTSHQIDGRQPAVHRHRQGRRRSGSDPPLHGPLAGLCGQGAVSRGAGHHRPGDRKRLLLRLSYKRPFTPEDLAPSRSAWPNWLPRTSRWCAACCRATRRGVFQGPGRALQGRDHCQHSQQ
jgi:threonyl-tRNA synthetase